MEHFCFKLFIQRVKESKGQPGEFNSDDVLMSMGTLNKKMMNIKQSR